MFEKSKWIWRNGNYNADEYAEFFFEFESNGSTQINISVDSDYALYINGGLSAFGQYADFPHYKIYDSVDVTDFCKSGINKCGIVVYYKGNKCSSTYYPSTPGLLFEIISDDRVVKYSDKQIKSRLSPSYSNHRCKSITGQLGYTFHYSLNKEDNWLLGDTQGFSESVILKKEVKLFPRPCKKTKTLERIAPNTVQEENGIRYIFDMGKEQVGFLDLDIDSNKEQRMIVAYGEHLADGNVRRLVGGRDFSVSFDLKAGKNLYMNPFLRLGCRYIELFFESPVKINYAGIRPVVYPLNVVETKLAGKRKEIYDAGVHTLVCCMHEHYEDCPWREQAMYTMDSRNQMLCGYYAFEEYEFPRASLKLIAESILDSDFLPICHPCGTDLVIPSFNLHFFAQTNEYIKYSKDVSLLKEIFPVLKRIIGNFVSLLDDNLVPALSGRNMWNFYEWTDGMAGKEIGEVDSNRKDLALNCLLVSALKTMSGFCKIIGEEDVYSKYVTPLLDQINNVFYVAEVGMYKNSDENVMFSQLGNALALLCGAATEKKAQDIAHKIINSPDLTKASLSMECYVYDALLLADEGKYKSYVISKLDEEYGYMLDQGATTFWETLDGEKAFDNAGSLCHGWSALPVYYYNTLL